MAFPFLSQFERILQRDPAISTTFVRQMKSKTTHLAEIAVLVVVSDAIIENQFDIFIKFRESGIFVVIDLLLNLF